MKINFKYIIVDSGAILFNENTTHSDVAKGFKKIYSAGFVSKNLISDEIVCYGHSDSLKIEAHPEIDKIIIADLFSPMSQIKYFGMSVKELYN